MISDIIFNNEKIANYFYRPIDDVIYVFLNIDNNFKPVNEWKQYTGEDFLKEFIKIKNSYGPLLKYEIIKIEYDFDLFPFYDYGYPHGIKIIIKCYYNNLIKKEIIYGYYIKEIGKTQIVSYNIDNF
jgi:hypothetical protein